MESEMSTPILEKAEIAGLLHAGVSVMRALGDREGEAVVLSNIGTVYKDLGDQQKAMEYGSQALTIRREWAIAN